MTTAPYGTWKSPFTAARVAAGSLRFDHLIVDGDDLYWVEGRPSEGGRNIIVHRTADGRISDATPDGFNVRTRVHEYGGAAYTVSDGVIYFSNFADQKVYRQANGVVGPPLTHDGYFYADFRLDRARHRLLCVREDHTRKGRQKAQGKRQNASGDTEEMHKAQATRPNASGNTTDNDEPVNSIVAVAVDGSGDQVLVTGADFYSDPIIGPDGSRMAWLQWNHPNMPWDGTELWIADVEDTGTLGAMKRVAGSSSESIFQPEWSPDGTLFFVSDRTGYWNLYRANLAWGAFTIEPLLPMKVDFGKPQWTFSQTTYTVISSTRLAVTYTEHGRWKLALVDTERNSFEPIDLSLQPLEAICASRSALFFIGGSATVPASVAMTGLKTREMTGPKPGRTWDIPEGTGTVAIIRSSTSDVIDPSWVSTADAITFDSNAQSVHAFYYAPKNPEFQAADHERPPLIVITHGGPTGATSDVLDERVQYWTSRGFAVLDVNYSGSTGFGREYRERLKGEWGVVDVIDSVNAARHMVRTGKANPSRLIIRGGSAGGYTTLAALAFHDTFKAGASYYGVSDIEVLARDTHKFESRYLDSLIGPYPATRDLYRQRSPIHFADRLSSALILFQGLDDKVVPPNQSEMMAAAVRRKGLPVAYLAFAGEQHGFRKAETIVRSLEAELYFYGAVFGFAPADKIEPVMIENLQSLQADSGHSDVS